MPSERQDDDALLDGVRLLAPLSEEQKRALAAIAHREHVSVGTTLFREADPSENVYLLLEGRVSLSMRVEGRGDTVILTLGAGELLGWSAMLPNRPHQKRVAGARASESCVMLRMKGDELLALCERDHDIGYVIMREAFVEMAHRLHHTRLQFLDMFRGPRE